jgi:hypothetical protein
LIHLSSVRVDTWRRSASADLVMGTMADIGKLLWMLVELCVATGAYGLYIGVESV